MIALADKSWDIEPQGGLFVMTTTSGGEDVQVAITRPMLYALIGRAKWAEDQARLADLAAAEVLPFRAEYPARKARAASRKKPSDMVFD